MDIRDPFRFPEELPVVERELPFVPPLGVELSAVDEVMAAAEAVIVAYDSQQRWKPVKAVNARLLAAILWCRGQNEFVPRQILDALAVAMGVRNYQLARRQASTAAHLEGWVRAEKEAGERVAFVSHRATAAFLSEITGLSVRKIEALQKLPGYNERVERSYDHWRDLHTRSDSLTPQDALSVPLMFGRSENYEAPDLPYSAASSVIAMIRHHGKATPPKMARWFAFNLIESRAQFRLLDDDAAIVAAASALGLIDLRRKKITTPAIQR